MVVGVSYDSPKVLADFARKSKITYPLLSDPESKVIAAYGVLNKASASGRLKGIPHPATFLIDSKGVIRDKLAIEGYRDRHGTDELVKAAKKVK